MRTNRSNETEMTSTPTAEPESIPASVSVRERIAQRAYELYEQRGSTPGNEYDDWLRAEAEVRAALGSPARDDTMDDFATKERATAR
jgi:hypothetical protein